MLADVVAWVAAVFFGVPTFFMLVFYVFKVAAFAYHRGKRLEEETYRLKERSNDAS